MGSKGYKWAERPIFSFEIFGILAAPFKGYNLEKHSNDSDTSNPNFSAKIFPCFMFSDAAIPGKESGKSD